MKSSADLGVHPHLRPGNIALVFAGGAIGVFARELLMLAVADVAEIPVAVFIANMLGALLLGWLLEALAESEAASPNHRASPNDRASTTGRAAPSEAALSSEAASARRVARRRRLRLLLGTGLLGGFTTYSALAQAVALLTVHGQLGLAVGYGLATVFGGALCTWCGVLIATRITSHGSGGNTHG